MPYLWLGLFFRAKLGKECAMNTDLDCSVTYCTHNTTGKCSLTDIKVGGDSADSSSDTCCSSFAPKRDSMTNSSSEKKPKDSAKIRCEARHCMHNSFGGCAASSIQIETCDCETDTSNCKSTQCSTFRM